MKWRIDSIQDANVNARRYYSLIILGIILPFLLSPFFSVIFLSSSQSFAYRFIASRFLIWGELGIMVLYAQQAEIQKFLLWAEESYKLSFYLKSIGALYLLTIAAQIIARIPFYLGLHEKNLMIHKMDLVIRQYPIVWIFTCFTAGVTEEYIFRGYILSRLSMFSGSKHLPIIVSALLFAYVHLGYHSASELIFTFLLGLIFGYHYQKYRNIRVLMMVHFVVDIIATAPVFWHR